MEPEVQVLIEKIVNERLHLFTSRLISIFPDKEYELRKVATGVGRSGLDMAVNCIEVLEDSNNFISASPPFVVKDTDIPAHIRSSRGLPEASIAAHDFVEQLTSELNKRNDLTIREIARVLEDHVEKLKGLDRVRELAGIIKRGSNAASRN